MSHGRTRYGRTQIIKKLIKKKNNKKQIKKKNNKENEDEDVWEDTEDGDDEEAAVGGDTLIDFRTYPRGSFGREFLGRGNIVSDLEDGEIAETPKISYFYIKGVRYHTYF